METVASGVGIGPSAFTTSPSIGGAAGASGSAGASVSASGSGSFTPICCRYSIAPDALKSNSLLDAACC